jgi:hypothetical protein
MNARKRPVPPTRPVESWGDASHFRKVASGAKLILEKVAQSAKCLIRSSFIVPGLKRL